MPNEKNLNIHQKLLKIADAAGILQKTKSGYNYKYVPEEEIQAKVTAGMQKYKVMLYHSIVPGTLNILPYSYSKYDKKEKRDVPVNEFIVSADTVYTWVDVENPEDKYHVPWVLIGQMEDASQAFGAAETYCNRYFLMKSLQLATSEADPDDYRSKQKAAEGYEDEKVKKEAEELLKKSVKEVVDFGSKLMKLDFKREEIQEIVGKYNDGNQNPSSIKTLEVCAAVMKEFQELEKKKSSEKKTKTTKGEQK
jgi:hypothetical protein